MGRAKLPIKPIDRERSRNETFKKRRKGLIKKTSEFATLCDVDAYLICYGPQEPFKAETWPENESKVCEIIDRYRGLSKEDQDRRKLDLSSFLEDKKRKMERELDLRRKQNAEMLYPSWDDQLNGLQEQQLRELLSKLDSKLEIVKMRLELIKGQNSSIKGKEIAVFSQPNPIDHWQQYILDGNINWNNIGLAEIQNQLLPISVKPSDQFHIPLDSSYNSAFFFDASSYGNFSTNYNNCTMHLPMPPVKNEGFGMWDNEVITNNSMFHRREEFCNVNSLQYNSTSLPFFNGIGTSDLKATGTFCPGSMVGFFPPTHMQNDGGFRPDFDNINP
ncbi:MADS-box protein defh21-like [Tasmannia lanceolata]|uniref:MADS-box protein defh21-like n=1 Tax=Tasmannia lanceolata TaxID=3420 RepID=UPI004064A681